MDSQGDLQERIRSSIEPWLDSVHRPPFSEEQLVVMALAEYGAPMTAKAIYEWICEKLPYYSRLAREFLWESAQNDFGPPPPVGLPGSNHVESEAYEKGSGFRHRFRDVFFRFEVPITEIMLEETIQWTVPAHEARIYLQPILANKEQVNDQPFPFLKLPPEVRLKIYEMLFAFPRSGIRAQRVERYPLAERVEITTFARSLADSEVQKPWFRDWAEDLKLDKLRRAGLGGMRQIQCRPPNELLSPLLVCSLVYKEAMPVFLDINSFVFLSVAEMFDALERLAKNRRKYLRHIQVDVSDYASLYSPPNQRPEVNHKNRIFLRRTEILETCTGLADVVILARGYPLHLERPFERSGTGRKELRHLVALFRSLRHCRIRFGGPYPTALETELGEDEVYEQIGRDMICA